MPEDEEGPAISRRRTWRPSSTRIGNLSEEQRRRRGSQDAATSGHRPFTRRHHHSPAPHVKVDVRETPHTTWHVQVRNVRDRAFSQCADFCRIHFPVSNGRL